MKMRMNRIALVAGACAAAALLAVACSSGSKKKTPGGGLPDPVEKGTGGAANFACNHSFTDGAAQSTGPQVFSMIVQSTTKKPGFAGAHIVLTDPATASTAGNIVYVTSSTGGAVIPVPGNTRMSWKNSAANGLASDNYVDTYEFNRLTLTTADAATTSILTRIVDQTAYGGLSALATGGATLPTGSSQVAGAVEDCDGTTVKNAQVQVTGATPCSDSPVTFPCIAYFNAAAGVPNRNATATDVDGQFLILGATPGSISVTVVGTTSGTATATIPLGSLDVVGVANSVSLGSTTPLAN